MNRTSVRHDEHGPYVRAGGYLFRPVHPRDYHHLYRDGTVLAAGDSVRVSHRAGTQRCHVRWDGGREEWQSHGIYVVPGGGSLPSNTLWKPGDPNRWKPYASRHGQEGKGTAMPEGMRILQPHAVSGRR